MSARILIADDDDDIRLSLKDRLCARGYEIFEARSGFEVVDTLKKCGIDLVILDLQLGEENSLKLLHTIKNADDTLEIIMITGHGSIRVAVEAMREGCCDFMSKPINLKDLENRIEKAIRFLDLKLKRTESTTRINIIGESSRIKETVSIAEKLACTNTTVLITGETGVGKEVLAQYIHSKSHRANESFVALNCANLTEYFLEDELFGHEPGAFTGAGKQRRGKVALANKGTLFLDEIGEFPINLQAKLLRFLEKQVYYRVGGDNECKADVRIIAATNKNLIEEVKEKNFREDLYYRLNVFPIHISPLRERPEDIMLLVNHFLRSKNLHQKSASYRISDRAITRLESYRWPGNVREVHNIIERAKILSGGHLIDLEHLPLHALELNKTGAHVPAGGYWEVTRQVQAQLIMTTLELTGGNKTEAAKRLKIQRTALIHKMKDLSIHYPKG